MSTNIGISVIMPTYNQGSFIARAIKSLLLQSFQQWELIIINDGSTDYTEEVVKEYLSDERIKYATDKKNRGLGYSLNTGFELASFNLIAYLPSDDIYFEDHLQVLYDTITSDSKCILAYSGMLHNYNSNTFSHSGQESLLIDDARFQLVQVVHRKTDCKWLQREELVTDNLNRMFWNNIVKLGKTLPTKRITCEWVNHPQQRHKLIKETSYGGIHIYKNHYQVNEPIKFHSSDGHYIDEVSFYKRFRQPKENGVNINTTKRLKILIVGELAYNAERIYALEEYGHKLYGLWITTPEFYNTIGPLPFGNVEDIPLEHWKERVEEIKPDIIYALLNYQVIPLAHYIMLSNTGIPFVWHFKEGPFFARQNGVWKELIELYTNSDGQIFINQETKDWFSQFISLETPTYILDGDLPKKEWFIEEKIDLLSDTDGEIHTVMPGRPFGLSSKELASFANQKIHLHFYGEFFHSIWKDWIVMSEEVAPGYIHIHPNCTADKWAKEFGKYDAGWLHLFDSNNNGKLMRTTWNDLNYPARMSTLAAAGLPMIQKCNAGHIVATQNLTKQLGIGLFFKELENIRECFEDETKRKEIRENAWKHRYLFSFDYHVKDLTDFFYKVIDNFIASK
jgi:glycosyltransferase involved in cell wall biosynthesis